MESKRGSTVTFFLDSCSCLADAQIRTEHVSMELFNPFIADCNGSLIL
jgi:hypothetical protein